LDSRRAVLNWHFCRLRPQPEAQKKCSGLRRQAAGCAPAIFQRRILSPRPQCASENGSHQKA